MGGTRGSLTSSEAGEGAGEEEHTENKEKLKPTSNSGGPKDRWAIEKNRLFKETRTGSKMTRVTSWEYSVLSPFYVRMKTP